MVSHKGLTAKQACLNAAGQAFYQKGLSNCKLNTSQPAGTVLNITFSVIEPGRPDLNANVTRHIVLTCATGKLITPCSRHSMLHPRCIFCKATADAEPETDLCYLLQDSTIAMAPARKLHASL